MKILFILLITDSFGERGHALSFAKQLSGSKYIPVFFIARQLKDYFSETGFKYYPSDSLLELTEVLRLEKPSVIICCEYFSFTKELKNYLSSLKIPLATMDTTSFVENMSQGYFTIPENYFSGKDAPKNMVRIKPCPLEDPKEGTELIKYWNLYPDIKIKGNFSVVRDRYKLCPEEKIIFYSLSPGIARCAGEHGLQKYYFYLFNILSGALKKSGYKCSLFIISPFVSSKSTVVSESVTVHFLNYLPFAEYENILLNSSLVISDNIIQNSMSKAFSAGIGTLALINSRDIFENSDFSFYKFNVFPLGSLFPEEKAYYKEITKAEVFCPADVEDKIRQLLSKKNNDENEYLNKVKSLPQAPEILNGILAESI